MRQRDDTKKAERLHLSNGAKELSQYLQKMHLRPFQAGIFFLTDCYGAVGGALRCFRVFPLGLHPLLTLLLLDYLVFSVATAKKRQARSYTMLRACRV